MSESCKAIFSQPKEAKYKAYQDLVQRLYKAKDCDGLLGVVNHMFRVEGNDQHGRTYITLELVVQLIKTVGDTDAAEEDQLEIEDLLPLTEKIVQVCKEFADDFPDALMHGIKLLAQLYEADDLWEKAARQLTSFKFEKYRHCSAKEEEKVEWYVEAAELWLQCDENGAASQSIKKAHALVALLKDQLRQELVVRFKTCYARVFDCERKFLEAAVHYKQLSQLGQGFMSTQDMLTTLEKAVNCAILEKAGPSRSRVLAILYSDERSAQLPNFSMLEKIYKEQIIRDAEVKQFEERLSEHHKAITRTGRTVLQNAIIEHNMLAASRIYTNIKLDQLGGLLGISEEQAETLASEMIFQGRMNACIDQVEGLVEFSAGGDALFAWDAQLESTCQAVNHVLENITKTHPQYAC